MKLNPDILYDHLNQSLRLQLYGRRSKSLSLRRPEFYTGGGREFLSDHVYLVFSDRLPDNPHIGNGSVIISIGGIPQSQYLDSKCTCIVVEDSIDMFSLSNLVNSVYDLFDEWEKKLRETLDSTADLKAIVDASEAVFESPLIVLDKNFKYLAVSGGMPENGDVAALWRPDERDNVSLEGFAAAMESTRIDMSSREPYILNVVYPSLCTNLFANDQYIGSLTLAYVERQERASDVVLLKTLARVVAEAIRKLPNADENQQNMLREVLTDLLMGLPCSPKQLQKLNEYAPNPSYICIKFELPKKLSKAPLDYICGLIESALTHSIALHYETNVVAFINVNEGPNGEEKLKKELHRLLAGTNMKAGVSYRFSKLTVARSYYRQACIAVEHADLLNPEASMCRFGDCALSYLITHSTGEFPLDILLPEGLRQLFEMDSNSKTDYIQTLRAYLDNNLNISKAAQALYLHRSSLLERLQRIQNVIDVDMHDPDARLELEILLKAMELNYRIQQNRNP